LSQFVFLSLAIACFSHSKWNRSDRTRENGQTQ